MIIFTKQKDNRHMFKLEKIHARSMQYCANVLAGVGERSEGISTWYLINSANTCECARPHVRECMRVCMGNVYTVCVECVWGMKYTHTSTNLD